MNYIGMKDDEKKLNKLAGKLALAAGFVSIVGASLSTAAAALALKQLEKSPAQSDTENNHNNYNAMQQNKPMYNKRPYAPHYIAHDVYRPCSF